MGEQPDLTTSLADWEIRRPRILVAMQEIMGPLPGPEKRCAVDMQIEEEIDVGSHVRKLITYTAEPGSRTPAYLLVPKNGPPPGGRYPAVLCLHPTRHEGHKVVVGLADCEERNYASELADRGFVTLAPAYPLLANYHPDLDGLGYASGTMKAIWDNMRGLDLLASLPEVVPHGFGAIGHSLGGHNAIYTAVFDKRITVVASSCGFDSYQDYYDATERVWKFGAGWCQIRYMPRLSNYRGRLTEIPYDFQELLGALAPRPLFVNAPLRDGNFRYRSVDRCARAAKPVYNLLGAEGRLVIRHPDSNHNFPDAMRNEAYQMIDGVLQSR